MPIRVLVTGGAGFIGSHVAEELLAHGCEVRVVDALLASAHAPAADPHVARRAEFVRGDLRDPTSLATRCRGVDAVCHQAAMVGLGADVSDIADYVAHNDLATACSSGPRRRALPGRIVLASSMVVYGEGRYACAEHGIVRPVRAR
jgi:dTDP-L-rhamnose 4-epimerase